MDKKTKKKVDVLQKRMQMLRLQLSGAKKQMDDPEELHRLEKEVSDLSAEIEKLKSS